MEKFRFKGKHSGALGYKSKFHGTHQPCPHSGWTWKGHRGSNKSENRWKPTSQKSRCEELNFSKHARTKITSFAKSTHPDTPNFDFHQKSDENIRIGQEIGVITPAYLLDSSLGLFGHMFSLLGNSVDVMVFRATHHSKHV